jgi:hypothetical protein
MTLAGRLANMSSGARRPDREGGRLATGVGQMIHALLRLRADDATGATDLQRQADAILIEMGLGPPTTSGLPAPLDPPAADTLPS